MADVHLSPTVQRLLPKYGNELKERRGVDPAIIAYDVGPARSNRADPRAEDGLAQMQAPPEGG
jgi:hypothetical protein